MQSKRPFLITVLLLLISLAAFVAGNMFNKGVSPITSRGPLAEGREFTFSSSNNLTPAVELPTTPPDVIGLFVEQQDNTMIIQVVSLDTGLGGVVGDSSVDVNSAPKVEVIISSKTTIYRDTTQPNEHLSNETIHQTVEESTLDDLSPTTMITVWGRKTGDRIIASVLLFSNSLNFQKP